VRAQHLIAPALAAASLLLLSPGASAHPHVWVSVKATVLYADGSIAGLQEAWTFDEFYTAQAIEGLDKNGDGKYDREELAELAKVNIDGLKEFDYFTYAKLAGADRKLKAPENYWLEHTDKGILTLHFTVPLEQAAREDGEFSFSVFDPSFFIAFDLAEDSPVMLGKGAPTGCTAVVHEPADDEAIDDTKKLNEAFSSALGDGSTVSLGAAKTVSVTCAKS
jgi:ABC-type uncharacterized transport system substrate-binding protein